MLEERSKCKICGKEIEPTNKKGRSPVFCSEECRREKQRQMSNDYNHRRYMRDAEWRAHKNELNKASNARCRSRRKERAMQDLIEALYNAETKDEIEQILRTTVRIRAEIYS